MDPAAIALAVLSALAPYAQKGTEALAAELGKKALDLGSGLLQALRIRWGAKPQELTALHDFLASPNERREQFSTRLAVQLATDVELSVALEKILKGEAPEVIVRLIAEDTKRAVGAKIDEMHSGKLAVDMEMRRGEDGKGVEIKKLG